MPIPVGVGVWLVAQLFFFGGVLFGILTSPDQDARTGHINITSFSDRNGHVIKEFNLTSFEDFEIGDDLTKRIIGIDIYNLGRVS